MTSHTRLNLLLPGYYNYKRKQLQTQAVLRTKPKKRLVSKENSEFKISEE